MLAMLSGCAVMDISMQDTAIPLAPKQVEFGVYNAIGLDLSSAIVIEDSDHYDSDTDTESHRAMADAVAGIKGAVSIAPDTDIVGKMYISSASWGQKIGIKKLISKEDNRYFALIPALTMVKGANTQNDDEDNEYKNDFSSYGLELGLIYTLEANKYFSFSLSGRLNANMYSEVYKDIDYGPYYVTHGGVLGNVRLNLGALYLMTEFGAEYIPVVNGEATVFPIISLGLGLKL